MWTGRPAVATTALSVPERAASRDPIGIACRTCLPDEASDTLASNVLPRYTFTVPQPAQRTATSATWCAPVMEVDSEARFVDEVSALPSHDPAEERSDREGSSPMSSRGGEWRDRGAPRIRVVVETPIDLIADPSPEGADRLRLRVALTESMVEVPPAPVEFALGCPPLGPRAAGRTLDGKEVAQVVVSVGGHHGVVGSSARKDAVKFIGKRA